MTNVLIVNMFTMRTTGHAVRSRPTLNDDEQFRNGLVRGNIVYFGHVRFPALLGRLSKLQQLAMRMV